MRYEQAVGSKHVVDSAFQGFVVTRKVMLAEEALKGRNDVLICFSRDYLFPGFLVGFLDRIEARLDLVIEGIQRDRRQ